LRLSVTTQEKAPRKVSPASGRWRRWIRAAGYGSLKNS
jgi:hypothetical protein